MRTSRLRQMALRKEKATSNLRFRMRANVFIRGTSGEKNAEHEGTIVYHVDMFAGERNKKFERKLLATINASIARALKKSKSFFFMHNKDPAEITKMDLPRLILYESKVGWKEESFSRLCRDMKEMQPTNPEREYGLVRGVKTRTFPEAIAEHGKAKAVIGLGKNEYLQCIKKANTRLKKYYLDLQQLHELHKLGVEEKEKAWKAALKCLGRERRPMLTPETSFHAESPATYLLGEIIAQKLVSKGNSKINRLALPLLKKSSL